MDKKKEQNHETASEKKQQQKSDNSRQWLKLLPAAAVFAAVCVTCYQAEKTPVQTVEVSDADIMSTADIKSMLTLEDSADSTKNSKSTSDKNSKTSSKKTSSTKKKTSKIKTAAKKNTSTGAAAGGAGAAGGGGGAGTTYTPTAEVPQDGYVDGIYTGSGTGFGGTITVQVTVSNHQIAAINILDASSETAAYFANAQGVINKILASQSPNVDAVSGATYSSNGIIQAVQNALSQAMPSGSQAEATPIPEATPTPGPTPTSTPEPTKAPVPTPKPEEEQLYKDGTYTGTGKGYSGTVILTAKIKKGVITSLDVTHTDTPMFFDKAWGVLENEIIQNQTTEGIDTVSGATFSSKGILSAMKDILKQAKKGTAKPTPTPEPTATPKPTATPTPVPTATPEPTATPAPEITETPDITPDPDETPTPEPTQSPDENPDVTPEVTPTPEETPEPTPEPLGPYRDGTYSGSSYGYSGKVTVTVTISGGQIVSLEQTNKDSPEFFEVAWGTLNPQILANQSADGIDTVTGATFSSEGILGAARKALAQAAV